MNYPHQHLESADRDALYVVPALCARVGPNGGVVITRKFAEGIEEYVRRWPGPVHVCMRRIDTPSTNLDEVEFDLAELPFEFHWLPGGAAEIEALLKPARLVLCSLFEPVTPVGNICVGAGHRVAFIAEYNYDTRRRLINVETGNPLRRLRRHLYNHQTQRRFCRALRLADGVQCNGTPTYDEFRVINRRPFLFFDSRVRRDMMASDDTVRERTTEMLEGRPLRLAFSGRLINIKGVDHLPRVAAELVRLNVPFHMTICGDGPLKSGMVREVERRGLGEHVHFAGVLDFQRELVPFVSREVDLFVCCHRQGDPSCTYLETMSCGTPIVGYDNDAFAGVVRTAGVGWLTPIDQPAALARRIAELAEAREEVAQAAVDSLAFARDHSFERTMDRRVEHMLSCCEPVPAGLPA